LRRKTNANTYICTLRLRFLGLEPGEVDEDGGTQQVGFGVVICILFVVAGESARSQHERMKSSVQAWDLKSREHERGRSARNRVTYSKYSA